MTDSIRRAARLALLAVLGAVLPASAVEVAVPKISLEPAAGVQSAAAINSALAPLSAPSLSAPMAASIPLSAPALAAPSLSAAAAPVAASVVAPAAPALAAPAAASVSLPAAAAPRGAVAVAAAPSEAPAAAPALDSLRSAAASRGRDFGRAFDGGRAAKPKSAEPVFVTNDEGVKIMGRAARYYQEIRRMVSYFDGKLELGESLDVMDGTIADVRTKLLMMEAIAKDKKISDANTHLEQTLTWVDGLLDDGGRRVAVHTHQVFFHPAPAGPEKAASEIGEGNRRVDAYLKQAEIHFGPGGDAEKALGGLDEVVLAFDTRGYKEIKDHIKGKEAEFKAKFGGRIRFAYVDEHAPAAGSTAQVREDYNRLVEKYAKDQEGLAKIMEGVMYSRYVGILLELKTLQYYTEHGYTVKQSGRDMFGADGKYITELDAVVKSKDGKVLLVEAKSARVGLPPEEALRDKVLYKLDVYKKNQAYIERQIGGPLNVVFSFDVGGRDKRAAMEGDLVWKDENQKALMEYLEAQAPVLSAKYGFPVSFLFLNSQPGEPLMLYYQTPAEPQQKGGQGKGSGRRHGRR